MQSMQTHVCVQQLQKKTLGHVHVVTTQLIECVHLKQHMQQYTRGRLLPHPNI